MGQVITLPAPSLRPPEKISASHNMSNFVSSEVALDEWLQKRAISNEGKNSRTYVVCPPDSHDVIAYYALANGAIQRASATKGMQRNAPDPIPVMVLGRLAVAKEWEGRGIGPALLRDALMRTLRASQIAGIAAMVVHAKNARAAAFYARYDFVPSELHPLTFMLPMKAIEAKFLEFL